MGRRGPPGHGQAKGREAPVVPLRPVESAELATHDDKPIPPAPDGLSAGVVEAWRAYWCSPVSGAVETVDLPSVRRLFIYYDELERAIDGYRAERIVTGSTGQPRLSPFAAQIKSLEDSIHKLENELGLTPMSRVRLGITIGTFKKTVANLNAAAAKPSRSHDRNQDSHPSRRRKEATEAPVDEDDALTGWQEA